MSFKIPRPYDSHTHLLGIGERQTHWDLQFISEPRHFAELKPEGPAHRGEFYIGFGWKLESTDTQKIIQEIANYLPPSHPIFLSRWDGHGSILNKAAAQKLGLGADVLFLEEADHFRGLRLLPQYSDSQLESLLMKAKAKLHFGGFTHFRDMTATLREVEIWSQILDQTKDAFIEFNFPVFAKSDLAGALKDLHLAKKIESPYIRIQGVKLFIDGTLGSQTAMTSCDCGAKASLWGSDAIVQIIHESWMNCFDVSFHCIGEMAVDQVVDCARQVLSQGVTGRIHIEHCELLSKETLKKMKSIHASVHIQPSHAVGDLPALMNSKIPEDILLFPIESLLKNKIPVYFGSDAPVVESSVLATLKGLRALKFTKPDNVRKLMESCHSHPDPKSPKSEVCIDSEGKIQSLKFEERDLVQV